MFESVMAALFAVALWWLSTGLVLVAVRRFAQAEHAVLGYASALWAAGLAGLYFTRNQTNLIDAYIAFSSALMVWAWHEVSFLTGLVTGPRRTPAPPAEAHGRAPLRSAVELSSTMSWPYSFPLRRFSRLRQPAAIPSAS